MPSLQPKLITGETYHLFNRGVDKREIFLDKHDYVRFYQSLVYFNSIDTHGTLRLAKYRYAGAPELVEVIAYALLPNHFHLLVKQLADNGISEFMRRIGSGYTSYFNEKYDRSGALFQGTFKRVAVTSDEQFNYLFAYVNENHAVHNVPKGNDICVSSSHHYGGKLTSRIISYTPESYSAPEAVRVAKQIYATRQSSKDTCE